MQRLFLALGIIFLILGIMWPIFQRLPWGKLPGDIVIQRPGMTFFFPITTSIVVSLILSLILWLLRK
jgi:hypothetical protein